MTETEEIDAVFGGQGLKLAVVVPPAGVTFAVVVGQQQVEDVPPGLADRGGVALHADGRSNRIAARGLQRPLAFDLDHADAADAGQAEVFVIAEGGNTDAQLLGGLEDRRAQRHRDGMSVDRKFDLLSQRFGMLEHFSRAAPLAGGGTRGMALRAEVVDHGSCQWSVVSCSLPVAPVLPMDFK